jgi:hypothetical protein
MESLSFAEMGDQLVQDLDKELPVRGTKRWRCPADLKARVISYAKVCRGQGETIESIATRLGLVGGTLARWLRSDRDELAVGFRSVAVVASPDHHECAGSGGPLRLLTPRGYCVEGLDAQTLAFLLRVVE